MAKSSEREVASDGNLFKEKQREVTHVLEILKCGITIGNNVTVIHRDGIVAPHFFPATFAELFVTRGNIITILHDEAITHVTPRQREFV